MSKKITRRCKDFPTCVTLKSLLSSVRFHTFSKARGESKGFPTFLTFVSFYPSVNLTVNIKV